MDKEECDCEEIGRKIESFFSGKKCGAKKMDRCGGCSGIAYIIGIIGAATYYISIATGFWAVILGVLKALVWPGFLVFELLKFLGA